MQLERQIVNLIDLFHIRVWPVEYKTIRECSVLTLKHHRYHQISKLTFNFKTHYCWPGQIVCSGTCCPSRNKEPSSTSHSSVHLPYTKSVREEDRKPDYSGEIAPSVTITIVWGCLKRKDNNPAAQSLSSDTGQRKWYWAYWNLPTQGTQSCGTRSNIRRVWWKKQYKGKRWKWGEPKLPRELIRGLKEKNKILGCCTLLRDQR